MALSAQESAKSSTGSCKVCKQREMGVNQDVQAGGSLWGGAQFASFRTF